MEVTLHVYDLSQGMAAQMSPGLLGKSIGGIWHTGIEVFGQEFYFGGGICVDSPGMTPYGRPVEVHKMGTTAKTSQEFMEFLRTVSPRFTVATYHLLDNNCNNFSDECARFLTGNGIPSYIIDLPAEVMSTPFGGMLRPMIDSMQGSIQNASVGHEIQLPGGNAGSSTSTEKRGTEISDLEKLAQKKVRLDKAKKDLVVAKLKEFDSTVDENSVKSLFDYLDRAPVDATFPALDLLRLKALEEGSAPEIAAKLTESLDKFVLCEDALRPSLMMTIRVAVNLLCVDSTVQAVMKDDLENVLEALVRGLEHENSQVRLTSGSLALNIALSSREANCGLDDTSTVRVVCAVVERLNGDAVSETEASQLVGALGVLVSKDEEAKELAKTLEVNVSKFANANASPLSSAAKQLIALLSTA